VAEKRQPEKVADLVKEFAGRPGEFAKAINSRIKR